MKWDAGEEIEGHCWVIKGPQNVSGHAAEGKHAPGSIGRQRQDFAVQEGFKELLGCVGNSSQWRHEVITLDQFAGQASLLVRFQAICGYSNNLYIDNINISNGVTGNRSSSVDIWIGNRVF